MKNKQQSELSRPIEGLIHVIRGQRVMLDADLARIYNVPTKRLNQAVRRNLEKFPEDFAFQIAPQEVAILRSQFVTSSLHGGRRYLPFVFTEHGAIMAATVLNSPQAVQMSVFVVRAFVKMREALRQNQELEGKLDELEQRLTERLDIHDQALVFVLDELKKLREPLPDSGGTTRQIGFHVRERASLSRRKRRTLSTS